MSSNSSAIDKDTLVSYFVDIIREAPAYGWCGIDLTFHGGKVVKVEKRVGISVKGETSSQSGNL
jgi:hypothetical protein